MASRLTWQNVAAPDFSDALRGYEASGELFGNAAAQFSNALTGVAKRGREKASTAAMAQAMQTRDVGGWDQLMAQGGLGALGINADQATPEFMEFLQGYRGKLAGNRADDTAESRNQQLIRKGALDYKQAQLDYDQDGKEFTQRFDQTEWANDRIKTLADRDDTKYERSEADLVAKTQAAELAQSVTEQAYSKEEARQAIVDMDLSPTAEKYALSEVDAAADENWAISTQGTKAVQGLKPLQTAREALAAKQAESSYTNSDSKLIQLYALGTDLTAGYSNPVEGVISSLRGKTDGNAPDPEIYAARSGELLDVYSRLKEKHPQVPDEVIAAALEGEIRSTGVGPFWNEKFAPDEKGISTLLSKMDTPEERARLQRERAGIEREQTEWAAEAEELDRWEMEYGLAVTRGDKNRVKRIEEGLYDRIAAANPPERVPSSGMVGAGVPAPAAPAQTRPGPIDFGNVLAQAAGQNQPSAPAQAAIAVAQQQPVTIAVNQVLKEKNLPESVQRNARIWAEALDTNTNPRTGQPLQPDERMRLEAQIAALMQSAAQPTQGAFLDR